MHSILQMVSCAFDSAWSRNLLTKKENNMSQMKPSERLTIEKALQENCSFKKNVRKINVLHSMAM